MDRPSKKQKLSSDFDDSDRHVNKATDGFNLYDDLLLHILSFLPMQDVVRTSVLSKRWKNLWRSVPKIDFSETNIAKTQLIAAVVDALQPSTHWRSVPKIDFSERKIAKTQKLIAAIDTTLNNREALKIMEFWIHAECDLCPMDKVESWIDSVVKHKVEVLYWDLTPYRRVEAWPVIPQCIFQIKSLTTLSLKFCMIDLPPNFCLVSLKTLHFRSMKFDDEELTILLSNCPVLKDLTLENCNLMTDLKIIAMDSHLENLNIHEEDSYSDDETVFEISAPNLIILNFFGTPRRSDYIGKNLNSLVSVNFDFIYPAKFTSFWKTQKQILYGKFIEDFCHAKVIKLSCWCTMNLTFREILSMGSSISDTVTDLVFTTNCWKFNLTGLVYILKNFVRLEVLTINIMDFYDSEFCDFFEEDESLENTYWSPDDPSVFGLQKHLRIVKIHGFLDSIELNCFPESWSPEVIINWRNTEFEFIRFLLKNLTELETMIITPSEDLDIYSDTVRFDILFRLSSRLLAFPRSSPNARVLIHHDHLTGIRENPR